MMSAVGGTASSERAGGVDGLEAIMRRGGEGLRERMQRTELHLERVTAQAGAPLASSTVSVNGRRLWSNIRSGKVCTNAGTWVENSVVA